MLMRILAFLLLGVGPVATTAAGQLPPPATRGLQEVVVAVRDLDAAERSLRAVSGWQRRYRGNVDPARLAAWGVARSVRAREAVIGSSGSGPGVLRLVEFRGAQQVEIRSSARPFDTGGIFNINVFVRDIDAMFAAMQGSGFQGYADPSRYELFGKPYAGAIVRGQDGVVFNLLERGDRRYGDVPPFTRMSHVRNSTLMIPDFEAGRRFFEQQLGWQKRWEASPKWLADGRNNMGLPESLVLEGRVTERAASFAFSPEADGGTIEIFAFEGLRGHDYSERAHPPNLGLLMYVVMVPGVRDYLARIGARGVAPIAGPVELLLPPYGAVTAAVVRAPGGAWLMLAERRAP
jgi:catechol 2,3-dioxygenase-like lactoylglutathione lyase family enzyme